MRSWTPAACAAAMTASPWRRDRTGRCFPPRSRPAVPPPAAGSRNGARGPRWSIGRGRPRRGGSDRGRWATPRRGPGRGSTCRRRGADDAHRLSSEQAEAHPNTAARVVPGGSTLMSSTLRARQGRGRACRSASAGMCVSAVVSRRQLCRACTKPFQLAMASSAGAKARETRIEEAIMMPAVACPGSRGRRRVRARRIARPCARPSRRRRSPRRCRSFAAGRAGNPG